MQSFVRAGVPENSLGDVGDYYLNSTTSILYIKTDFSTWTAAVASASEAVLALKANLASPTFTGTVSGITKSMVGLGNVDNVADASKTFSASQITSGTLDPARAPAGIPVWTKYTKTYSDFSANNSDNYINVTVLPVGVIALRIIIKSSISFEGGSISSYNIEIGINGIRFVLEAIQQHENTVTYYGGDVDTGYDIAGDSGVSIYARAVSSGDTLNHATQGSLDIWVETITLP